jgi:hypothetical protein
MHRLSRSACELRHGCPHPWSISGTPASASKVKRIRALEAEHVALPLMVLEELSAQRAIKYREIYDAAQAVEALPAAGATSRASPHGGPASPSAGARPAQNRGIVPECPAGVSSSGSCPRPLSLMRSPHILLSFVAA